MISSDYTKEVGLHSHKKTLPRPVAFVVLAAVAVGASFGIAGVINHSKEAHAAEKAAAAPTSTVAPETPAVPAPPATPAAEEAPAK